MHWIFEGKVGEQSHAHKAILALDISLNGEKKTLWGDLKEKNNFFFNFYIFLDCFDVIILKIKF
jgi:hypothetical protein